MPLKIECQKVDTWKKKIIRDDLKGVSLDIENYCTVSLFFEQAYL